MFMCFTWSENVGCFSMDHVAAGDELFLGHAKRDSEGVFDEAEDE